MWVGPLHNMPIPMVKLAFELAALTLVKGPDEPTDLFEKNLSLHNSIGCCVTSSDPHPKWTTWYNDIVAKFGDILYAVLGHKKVALIVFAGSGRLPTK
jgi:hypothetical protein